MTNCWLHWTQLTRIESTGEQHHRNHGVSSAGAALSVVLLTLGARLSRRNPQAGLPSRIVRRTTAVYVITVAHYVRDCLGEKHRQINKTLIRSARPEGRNVISADNQKKAAVEEHWKASERGDTETEHAIYSPDAILDYPQSGNDSGAVTRFPRNAADILPRDTSRSSGSSAAGIFG